MTGVKAKAKAKAKIKIEANLKVIKKTKAKEGNLTRAEAKTTKVFLWVNQNYTVKVLSCVQYPDLNPIFPKITQSAVKKQSLRRARKKYPFQNPNQGLTTVRFPFIKNAKKDHNVNNSTPTQNLWGKNQKKEFLHVNLDGKFDDILLALQLDLL